jgi:hypothetical protein
MSPRLPPFRATALAVSLCLALACGDGDNGTGPDVRALVEAVLQAGGGTVVITDDGVAVTGADVSVNGTAGAPGATAGEYAIALAPPVATGGALTLDVVAGEIEIQGTGTVPEAGEVTDPADAALFDPAEEIVVNWFATASPDRWTVDADGPTLETFAVADGAARTFTIPAGSLAEGAWEIRVTAYDDGDLTGDTEAGSTMVTTAVSAANPTVTVGTPLLLIRGSDMGPIFNHVSLTLDGALVDGATVTVNGEAATQAFAGDNYHVQLTTPVPVGDPLDLSVTVGAIGYTATGNVPEPPDVTAPADAAMFAAADPIQVDWTATVDPDRFAIFVDGPTGLVNTEIAGNLRTFTIPGGTFTPGDYTISVFTYEDGQFTGTVHPESRMSIRGELGPFPQITVTP